MVCKQCNNKMKLNKVNIPKIYYNQLDYLFADFCCVECFKKYYRYNDFDQWFWDLLTYCDQCFERDILRDTKDYMWINWCKREAMWLDNEKRD